MARPRPRRGGLSDAALALVVLIGVAACSGPIGRPPEPTPESIPGVLTVLARHGVAITDVVSGDPGCDDPALSPTGTSLEGSGFDQAQPVRIHLYVFKNRAAFERLRDDVDACARSYVADPEEYIALATSPYVATLEGPVGSGFLRALEAGLQEAAGRGD